MTEDPIGVYGAGGWIGAAVSRQADRGGPVRRFSRSGEDGAARIPTQPEPDQLAEQLAGLHAVIITAGVAHAPRGAPSGGDYANAILPGVVVRAAKLAGLSRVVLVSSIKAVAERSEGAPVSDWTAPAPTTPYGRSKRLGECAALAAAGDEIHVCIVRPPLVIGADAPANFGRILRFIRRGIPIPLPHPHPYRSVSVRTNLADLLVHLARTPGSPNTYVTAAEQVPLTTSQLVAQTADALGTTATVLPIPRPVAVAALRILGRTDDIPRLASDLVLQPSGLDHTAGWRPRYDLASALRAEFAAGE